MPAAGWGAAAGVAAATTAVLGGALLGVDLSSGIDLPSGIDPSQLPDLSSLAGQGQQPGGGYDGPSADQVGHAASSAAHYLQNHWGGSANHGATTALTKRTGMPILRNVQDSNTHSCDICRRDIYGDRYRCLQCPDWDACPACAAACTEAQHDGRHRFIFIPANGKFVHCTRGVYSRICGFCHKGIKTRESLACLECDPLKQACIECGPARDQHTAQTGHKWIWERSGGINCDGCGGDLEIVEWWRCTTCPDLGFCAACIRPAYMQHTPGHYFAKTQGFESYNHLPWGRPDPLFPLHGDERFWGRLLDDNMRATPLLQRLGHAIFAYLDQNGPPGRTGVFEPEKNRWWNKQVEPSLTDLMEDEGFKIYHETFGTAFRLATSAQTGKPIAVLDQWGFMDDLVLSIRLDPDEAFRMLSYGVRTWHLVDPQTHQPFPQLPRSSLPTFPDPDPAKRLRDVFRPAYEAYLKRKVGAAQGVAGGGGGPQVDMRLFNATERLWRTRITGAAMVNLTR